MKQVLLCAFYFVPRNIVASYRPGCFAKYLPTFGWSPTVICEDWPKGNAGYDADFIGVLPECVRVIRVPNTKPATFYEKTIIRKVLPYVCAHRVPVLWWRQARTRMLELIGQLKFEAVWGTSDPLAPLAVAQETAQRLRCRWIADIRDSFNAQRFGSWYKRPSFAYQERRLCRAADIVTTVSPGLASVISQRTRRPVKVIHNGFDPALFEGESPEKSPLFRVVYAGTLVWPKQNPEPLLRALQHCIAAKEIPINDVEVAFYGSEAEVLRKVFPEAMNSLPIRIHPRVTHKEIIQVLKSSPVLLVLAHRTERGVLTSKLFDYLAAGGAILAIPDDHGDMAALLRRTGAGVSLGSASEIGAQLTVWYKAWKTGQPLIVGRDEIEISNYSRREQTRCLAGLLDEMSTS